ncbi:MAG: nucleotide-binding protein [Actinomycetes bacterium]
MAQVPTLAPGTRLLGSYEGSGFVEPHYLAVRRDQQVVHLPRLLQLVLQSLDGRRDLEAVAARVSDEFGRRLTPEGLEHLLETKLRPLGLVSQLDGRPVPSPRADPTLALSLRAVLVPAGTVRKCARALALLHAPVAVWAFLSAMVVVDALLLVAGGLPEALTTVASRPADILVLFCLLVAASLFHELGHASGCYYGGGRPGSIGVGLYLIVPAFYTNVTDAYRLDRRARLRTDLGGVYFNAIFLAVAGPAYLLTSYAPFLVLFFLTQLEMLQQLLPIVRLDGYFILSDLVGVPDLFGRVGPILRSAIPGRPVDPKVSELRPRVRLVVTVWVAVVVPLLAAGLGLLLWQLPQIVTTTVTSMHSQWQTAISTLEAGRYVEAALAVLAMVLLVLPLLGLVILALRVVERVAQPLLSRRRSTAAGSAPRAAAWPPEALMHPTQSRPPSPPGPPWDGHVPGPPTSVTPGSPSAPTPPSPSSPSPSSPSPSPSPPSQSPSQSPSPASPAPPSQRGGSPAVKHALSAESFSEEAFLRRRIRPPARGWRRMVYRGSRGRLNLGPSQAERRALELAARVKVPIRGSRRVVVLSRKGGAGKTTTALMLGHTFASFRGDRVVAVDANPDAGSLAHRIRRETSSTVTTLLRERQLIERYSDVRAYTSQAPTRLEVVASDDDPKITRALGKDDYQHVIDVLDRHYNLVLLDTGTGILDGGIQGILEQADQVVLVMPPALDGARVAAATLDWLEEHGYDWLVRGAVAVVNGVRGPGLVELDLVEDHFGQRCAAVVRIPWDPVLEAGAGADLTDLRRPTREAYVELAAAVADGFRSSSRREQPS